MQELDVVRLLVFDFVYDQEVFARLLEKRLCLTELLFGVKS